MAMFCKSEIPHGSVRYFKSDYCENTDALKRFNQHKILAKELVSFDCGLLDLECILREDIDFPTEAYQYLAVIMAPACTKNEELSRDDRFSFVGYDLVEEMTGISAITNCGAGFSRAIDYEALNASGIFSDYALALQAKQRLIQQYPNENHADCEIVEIWRYAKRCV